jgi:hypothetical protein
MIANPFAQKSSCGQRHLFDKTVDIVLAFAKENPFIISEQNLRYTPARKQVQAFLKGFETLDDNYDVKN